MSSWTLSWSVSLEKQPVDVFSAQKVDKYPNPNGATAFFQGVVSLPHLRTVPNTSWMARRWAAFIPSTSTETPARACRCTATWPRTREAGLWVSPLSPETQVFSFPDYSHDPLRMLRCSSGARTAWPIFLGSGATIALGLETWRMNSGSVSFNICFYNVTKPPRRPLKNVNSMLTVSDACKKNLSF